MRMLIVSMNHWFRRQADLCQAAVLNVIVNPTARLLVQQHAQCHADGDPVGSYKNRLPRGMARVDLHQRIYDSRSNLIETFATGWREGGIGAGSIDEIVLFSKVAKQHVFPFAYSHLCQPWVGLDLMALAGHGQLRCVLTTYQRAGVDRVYSESGLQVAGGPFRLTAAAPGQRAVGRAMPAA